MASNRVDRVLVCQSSASRSNGFVLYVLYYGEIVRVAGAGALLLLNNGRSTFDRYCEKLAIRTADIIPPILIAPDVFTRRFRLTYYRYYQSTEGFRAVGICFVRVLRALYYNNVTPGGRVPFTFCERSRRNGRSSRVYGCARRLPTSDICRESGSKYFTCSTAVSPLTRANRSKRFRSRGFKREWRNNQTSTAYSGG